MTSKDDTSWILFEKYPIWFWPSFHCLRFYGALEKIIAPKICHNCRKIIHIWFKTKKKCKQMFMIIEIIGEALGWRTFIHRGYMCVRFWLCFYDFRWNFGTVPVVCYFFHFISMVNIKDSYRHLIVYVWMTIRS